MENTEKELKNLRVGVLNNKLSLRKKKINNIIFKHRQLLNNENYSINISHIIVKPEFKEKKFPCLKELFQFSSNIFKDKKSDLNDIKYIIYLLKKEMIKYELKEEINETSILKDIVHVLNKFINEIIVVEELLCLLINFTFFLQSKMYMDLLTNEYIKIYSDIYIRYFNDDIIFNDLIILFGNLVNDNPKAQNIFYTTKLYEQIYNLFLNQINKNIKKDTLLFFLASFSIGISNNKELINDKKIWNNLINLMSSNLIIAEYSKNCLISLGALSEITNSVEYIIIKREIFDFIYENNNTEFYSSINKLLINLTCVDDKYNLFMIENYKSQIFSYLKKILNSPKNIIKGQGLFLLSNLMNDEPSQINEILKADGFYDKIFENMNSLSINILDNVTFLINLMVDSSDKVAIFKLYQNNIHLKLLNILKITHDRGIIFKTIDAIIGFLKKDTNDEIIKQSLLDNGIKEIFDNLEINRNDAELYIKVEEFIKIFS